VSNYSTYPVKKQVASERVRDLIVVISVLDRKVFLACASSERIRLLWKPVETDFSHNLPALLLQGEYILRNRKCAQECKYPVQENNESI
jgi:hypothetical protein